jgi:hypothetical protein
MYNSTNHSSAFVLSLLNQFFGFYVIIEMLWLGGLLYYQRQPARSFKLGIDGQHARVHRQARQTLASSQAQGTPKHFSSCASLFLSLHWPARQTLASSQAH